MDQTPPVMELAALWRGNQPSQGVIGGLGDSFVERQAHHHLARGFDFIDASSRWSDNRSRAKAPRARQAPSNRTTGRI